MAVTVMAAAARMEVMMMVVIVLYLFLFFLRGCPVPVDMYTIPQPASNLGGLSFLTFLLSFLHPQVHLDALESVLECPEHWARRSCF